MSKVALITGIRRIGLSVASALLEEGYNLAVVYNKSEEEANRLKKIATTKERDYVAIKADLSDERAYDYIVRKVESHFGRLDAFIHLASPYVRTPLREVTSKDFDEHMLPIAKAFFFIAKGCADLMDKNEGPIKGRVVAFGDWAVLGTPYRDFSAYFLAKGALHTAVKVLAKELAPHILINCIALGPVLKPEGMPSDDWERLLRNTPLKREVSLKDVVNLTLYLLRTEGMTGEIIALDGGRHLAGSGVRGQVP